MLIKNRDQADSWAVYHGGGYGVSDPQTDYFILDTDVAVADSAAWWNDTTPTSSVFTVATDHAVNADGEKYVAYVFAPVRGYSQIGSYQANSSSTATPNHQGTFIYLGFRPAWVLIKQTGANAWNLHDNKRATINPMQAFLRPATNGAEVTNEALDFYSNGFKLRSASGFFDHADATYFTYVAFAEQPFKYANAK